MHYGQKLKIAIVTVVVTVLPFGAAVPCFGADQLSTTDGPALVVASCNSQWTSNGEHSIILNKGAVVVIAGKEMLKVETCAGTVEVSPNLEAVIQEEDTSPITVTAIACRTTSDENSLECALTVATNDDSTYKVYPGKQLKLTVGEAAEVSDVVMLKQQPELATSIRKAANDLASAVFVLLSDANAGNTQTIDSCARALMAGSADGPVKMYVTEGKQLVALQPGSCPVIAAAVGSNVKPKPKVQDSSIASSGDSSIEDRQLSRLESLSASTERSAWNTGHSPDAGRMMAR